MASSQSSQGTQVSDIRPDTKIAPFGFGLYLAWYWMLHSTARIFPLAGFYALSPNLLRLIGLGAQAALVMGALFVSARRPLDTFSDTKWTLATACTASFSTALLYLGSLTSETLFSLLCCLGWVLWGLSGGALTLLWVKYYGTTELRELSLYISGSIAIGAALVYVLCYLPPQVAVVATAALPAISASMFHANCEQARYQDKLHEDAELEKRQPRPPDILVRRLVDIGVYTLVFAVLIAPLETRRGLGFETNGGYMLGAPFVVGVGFYLLTYFTSYRHSLRIVYRCILPLMVIALLVFPFAQGTSIEASGFLGHFAFECFEIVCWIVVYDCARSQKYSKTRALLYSRALYSTVMLLGTGLGMFLASSDLFKDKQLFTVLCLGAVVILVIISMALLHESEPLNQHGGAHDKTLDIEQFMESAPSADEIFNDKVTRVAAHYSLTPRETEVFALLARGRTNKHIEKELVISDHTVDSHVTHIYRKCNVHSRQEIIDLVDKERPSRDNPYTPVGAKGHSDNNPST